MSNEKWKIGRPLPGARPLALTIAGLDPSGGAGIIADVTTFLAFGCSPAAAVTSLTFQSARAIFGAAHQTTETLRAQVLAIIEHSRVACVKTGMLPTREIVFEVARLLRETELPAPVVDPVMKSTSGYDLMDEDALDAIIRELVPLARVVTPNIPEAEAVTGERIEDERGMRRAARQLREMGARAVLVKGGHLKELRSEIRGQRSEWGSSPTVREGLKAIDVLDDEGRITVFRGDWIDAPPVRGTGCMLSAAIAACLGKGMTLENSVSEAKRFVAGELERRHLHA